MGKWRDIVRSKTPSANWGNDDGGPQEGAPRRHSAGMVLGSSNCRKVVISIDLEGQSVDQEPFVSKGPPEKKCLPVPSGVRRNRMGPACYGRKFRV